MKPTIVPAPLVGSPQDVYARIGAKAGTVLLESSLQMPDSPHAMSGWSFIAGPALATLQTIGSITTLRTCGDEARLIAQWGDPFEAIAEVLAQLADPVRSFSSTVRADGPPFTGGLIGHLGYDIARFVERLPAIAADDPPLPAMSLHMCDHVLAFDHAQGQWHFCTQPLALDGVDTRQRASVWTDTLARASQADAAATHFSAGTMHARTDAPLYIEQVRRVLDYIAAGDIFQANLSRRLDGPFSGDPFALYRALTRRNPAPFSAFIPGDGFAIAGVSPERFLKLQGREVVARPIKGTLPRDADVARDTQQRERLQTSIKDRAENVMIVDLMRNDLGRVAQVGSVRVEALFEAEAHPSVWQLVSTVTARLRDGASPADLLRACWPPGSMTGAPKVRAMEIIESLEPVRRGPYAGAVGYFDAGGAMDLSVVIRTAVVHGNRVMVQLGGAVVSDSDPQAELAETEAKGRLLLEALKDGAPWPA